MVLDPRTLAKPKPVNEILQDRGIRHSIYVGRFKTHEVNSIVGLLNRNLFPPLLGKL